MIILSLDITPDKILSMINKSPTSRGTGSRWFLESRILEQAVALGKDISEETDE
jgi:hypothetical protein